MTHCWRMHKKKKDTDKQYLKVNTGFTYSGRTGCTGSLQ